MLTVFEGAAFSEFLRAWSAYTGTSNAFADNDFVDDSRLNADDDGDQPRRRHRRRSALPRRNRRRA